MANIPDSNRAFRAPGMDLTNDGSARIAQAAYGFGEQLGRGAAILEQGRLMELRNRQGVAMRDFNQFAGSRLQEIGQAENAAIPYEQRQEKLLADLGREGERLMEGLEFDSEDEREIFRAGLDEVIENTGALELDAHTKEIRKQTFGQLSVELDGLIGATREGRLMPEDAIAGAVSKLSQLGRVIEPARLDFAGKMLGQRFFLARRDHLMAHGRFEEAAELFSEPEGEFITALFNESDRARQVQLVGHVQSNLERVQRVQNSHAMNRAMREAQTVEDLERLQAAVAEGETNGRITPASALRIQEKMNRRAPAIRAREEARDRVMSVLEGGDNNLEARNPADRRAVDQVYGEWLQSRSGLEGMEAATPDLAIELYDETGILPRQVALRIRKALTGGRGADMVAAIDWIGDLEADGQLGQLGLSDREYAVVNRLNQLSLGEELGEEELEQARAILRPVPAEERSSREAALSRMQPAVKEWAEAFSQPILARHKLPDRLAGYLLDDYSRSFSNWFLQSGDEDLSRHMAEREILASMGEPDWRDGTDPAEDPVAEEEAIEEEGSIGTTLGKIDVALNAPFAGALRGLTRAAANIGATAHLLDQADVDRFFAMVDEMNEVAVRDNPSARVGGIVGEEAGRYGPVGFGAFNLLRRLGMAVAPAVLTAEGVTGAVVLSPEEENLFNSLEDHLDEPALKQLSGLLATDPDAPEWENRARNASEAILVAGLSEQVARAAIAVIRKGAKLHADRKARKVGERLSDLLSVAGDKGGKATIRDLDGLAVELRGAIESSNLDLGKKTYLREVYEQAALLEVPEDIMSVMARAQKGPNRRKGWKDGVWSQTVSKRRALALYDRIHKELGREIDLDNAIHVVQADDVQHALNRHGEDVVGLEKNDINHIPEVVRDGEIHEVSISSDNQVAVTSRMLVNGDWLFVVEVARGGGHQSPGITLAFKTAYKQRGPKDKAVLKERHPIHNDADLARDRENLRTSIIGMKGMPLSEQDQRLLDNLLEQVDHWTEGTVPGRNLLPPGDHVLGAKGMGGPSEKQLKEDLAGLQNAIQKGLKETSDPGERKMLLELQQIFVRWSDQKKL